MKLTVVVSTLQMFQNTFVEGVEIIEGSVGMNGRL